MALPVAFRLTRVNCRYHRRLLPIEVRSDGSRRVAMTRNREWTLIAEADGDFRTDAAAASAATLKGLLVYATRDGMAAYTAPSLTAGKGITIVSGANGEGRYYASVPDYDWKTLRVTKTWDAPNTGLTKTVIALGGREDYFRFDFSVVVPAVEDV